MREMIVGPLPDFVNLTFIRCSDCGWGASVKPASSLSSDQELDTAFESHNCADSPRVANKPII
jgi:hypothetical protein